MRNYTIKDKTITADNLEIAMEKLSKYFKGVHTIHYFDNNGNLIKNLKMSNDNPFKDIGFKMKFSNRFYQEVYSNFVYKKYINYPTIPLDILDLQKDIFFQRLQYIESKNNISFVCYYSTPIMQMYDPQISVSGGPFVNPIISQLNLANPSNTSSALIVIDRDGKLSYSSRLYSDISSRYMRLYDIAVDESTSTNRSIKIVGLSNTEELQCIDSTGLNVQVTYSNIDPLTQTYLVMYSYDLDGIYQYSNRVEFPANMAVNVQDIKSFSLNNRIVTFPNILSFTPNQNIVMYNKDGSLATLINDYISDMYNSLVLQFIYDPTYTDVNNISYSKIFLQDFFNFTPESLINYNLFIQGNLFDSTTTPTTQIASTAVLNQNFSIRHNFQENLKDVLNEFIPEKLIAKYDKPQDYWLKG
jgi:hypothetical protein